MAARRAPTAKPRPSTNATTSTPTCGELEHSVLQQELSLSWSIQAKFISPVVNGETRRISSRIGSDGTSTALMRCEEPASCLTFQLVLPSKSPLRSQDLWASDLKVRVGRLHSPVAQVYGPSEQLLVHRTSLLPCKTSADVPHGGLQADIPKDFAEQGADPLVSQSDLFY